MFAFQQGQGGESVKMEFLRRPHPDHETSTGHLIQEFEANNTNAYMLLYVRETERESIMSDSLSLQQQIPQEITQYFEMEDNYRTQISTDDTH